MQDIPRVSEAEWEVMKLLWEKSPSTANSLVEALSTSKKWNPKTIKTLLNRLVTKKALGFERKGREYHYYPLVARTECVMAESRSFIKRVYGGALKPMIAAFLENEDITAEDLKEFRDIIDKKGSR